MNEYKIVIDPGHGGEDPGSSGNGIIEKNLNLQISEYMYDRFRELGIPVKITRSTDETISPENRVKKVLDAFGNSPNVIVISNHINAGGGEGAEVIYALRNNDELSNLVLDEIGKEGQKIRKAYQRRLPSNTSKDYYFMQRETGLTQPITVEYGFLDNTADASKLKANSIKYAEAVVRAVLDYIGYNGQSSEDTYTVKSGDSLYSIAKKYNLSIEELKAANNLSSNLLNVGQVLKIPGKSIEKPVPGDYIVYTVAKGDNLYNLANKYNTTVNDIINYNNLSSTNLNIGQKILIPVKETAKPSTDYETYVVKPGDNLYKIAQIYNTTMDNLMNINNLSTNLLSINQKILVPKLESKPTPPTSNTTNYSVKAGDSLYSIAKKYNTTTDEIKKANNLSTSILSIGQILKIPVNNQQVTYTVRSGDNLYLIANKYNTTVDELKRKNNLSTNLLKIGQILVI